VHARRPSGRGGRSDRALALSPNLALGYWRRAPALIFSGRQPEGLADLQTSLRLDPRGGNLAPRPTQLAVGYYFSRAYEETVEAAKQAIRSFPGFEPPHRYLAAAAQREAKIALEQAIEIETMAKGLGNITRLWPR
jgi:tetratricopeptide (TPR) repeat protein